MRMTRRRPIGAPGLSQGAAPALASVPPPTPPPPAPAPQHVAPLDAVTPKFASPLSRGPTHLHAGGGAAARRQPRPQPRLPMRLLGAPGLPRTRPYPVSAVAAPPLDRRPTPLPAHAHPKAGPCSEPAVTGQGDRPPPRSAYVHIPFCRRRCFYCDFAISVVGSRPGAVDTPAAAYCNAVLAEMAHSARTHGAAVRQAGGLTTLYFGGGTPSLLPPELLRSLIVAARDHFTIAPGAEITVEMDPGTFDAAKLAAYMAAGVNRVSLGVQSLDPDTLAGAGRVHTADDALEAVDIVRAAGLDSWSVDLIAALPGMSLNMWTDTLHRVVREVQPPHISVYDLQVEPGTAFNKWYTPGVEPLPSEETAAEMYRQASSILRGADYEHYEVSSYARLGLDRGTAAAAPGTVREAVSKHRSRHNSVYWDVTSSYFGFGLGASSFVDGVRHTRPRTQTDYEAEVRGLLQRPAGGKAVEEGAEEGDREEQSDEDEADELQEEVMVALRTSDGLDVGVVRARHGEEAARAVLRAGERAVQMGLAQLHDAPDKQDPVLQLTDPDGFLLSNMVIRSIFNELEESECRVLSA